MSSTKDNKTQKWNRFYALDALEAICSRYSSFLLEDVMFFCPVFYPIALIDVEMLEKDYEDLEMIPRILLALVKLGFSSIEELAEITGLNNNYTSKMMRLLAGNGLIEKGSITEAGIKALDEGKNIHYKNTSQKFQIDAVSGKLIRQEQLVLNGELFEKGNTEVKIPHIRSIEGIYSEDLEKELLNERGGLVNINVDKIEGIKLSSLKYSRAYMLQTKSMDEPFVFSFRLNCHENDRSKKYAYQPYYVWSEEDYDEYGIERHVPIANKNTHDLIDSIVALVKPRSAQTDVIIKDEMEQSEEYRNIQRTISYYCPFDWEHTRISFKTQDEYLAFVFMTIESINTFNSGVFRIIYQIGHLGYALILDKSFNGSLVKVVTNEAEILQVAHMLKEKCDKYGYNEIRNRLINSIAITDQINILAALKSKLLSMDELVSN